MPNYGQDKAEDFWVRMTNNNIMAENTILLSGNHAKYYKTHHPSAKKTAHFYGGNGFALGVYQPLINDLAQHLNLTALTLRGEWHDKPTANTLTREQDADLLIEFLQKTQDKPVVGIGHSQGATATAIAAAKCPALFSQLFLLEPVTFTKQQTLLYNRLPRWLKMTQEPFKSTEQKQADWRSVEDYYQYLRQHKAYKRVSDAHLLTYANNSLMATADGTLSLRFAPAQELANYFGTPFINSALATLIAAKQVPVHLVIGKPSMFISEKVRQTWDKFVPRESITVLNDYGHLLPLEAPALCAKLIIEKC